ncbi:MAG: DUF4349 domain-containing protein [Streptosporangiales bacterium]|nr:DUF4349 domain-containing protein [Streptosporangiales bacterium]
MPPPITAISYRRPSMLQPWQTGAGAPSAGGTPPARLRDRIAIAYREPACGGARQSRMRKTFTAALGGVALATALLAGCSGGGTEESSGDALSAPRDAGGAGAGDARSQAGEAAKRAPGAGSGSGKGAPAQPVHLASQKIIYESDLGIRSGDVPGVTARARQAVRTAGGYVARESSSESGSAQLTLKVPVAEYENVIGRLGGLGKRLSLNRRSQDVTQEVADVESRVRSAKASLDRLRALMAEATSVGEVMSVEQEISERESELESLQARQKSLEQQTTYGTIRLSVYTPPDAPAKPEEKTFITALGEGWQALLAAGTAVLVLAGWMLPFLAFIALFAVPAFVLWRRRRVTPPSTPPAPAEAAD